jgi:uncharacterized protein YciI
MAPGPVTSGEASSEFDTYELVLLRRSPSAPALDEKSVERLQRQHLGHLEAMRLAGHLLVAGPFADQPDDDWRGLCIYRVGSLDEARRLASSDPAVRADRLAVEVMHWYTPKGKGSARAWLFGIARHVYADHCAEVANAGQAHRRLAAQLVLDEDEIGQLVEDQATFAVLMSARSRGFSTWLLRQAM